MLDLTNLTTTLPRSHGKVTPLTTTLPTNPPIRGLVRWEGQGNGRDDLTTRPYHPGALS